MELIWIVSVIPKINNNSIKGIKIVTSKIFIGLKKDFIVTKSFAIGHSFHGILDFNWERYDAMFVEHIALTDIL